MGTVWAQQLAQEERGNENRMSGRQAAQIQLLIPTGIDCGLGSLSDMCVLCSSLPRGDLMHSS